MQFKASDIITYPSACSWFCPKKYSTYFPKPLLSLYQPSFTQLDFADLLSASAKAYEQLYLTTEMVEAVEKETRLQSHSKLWYKFRAGRVTASKMKAVCRTSIDRPSKSLILSICYPELFRFTTAATRWGCTHERSARDCYKGFREKAHTHFSLLDSGLILNPEWPFLGASPDGTVHCDCCGSGVVEIKCPYCHHHDSALENQSCHVDNGDCLQLDRWHYYYQVQTQIFVSNVDYCDFCVCIPFLLGVSLVFTLSRFYLILSFGLSVLMLHPVSLSIVRFLKF